MKKVSSLILIQLVIISLATGVVFAGSQNGEIIFDRIPLFAVGIGLAFVINWIAFIPAFILQTEKFFDLTGSITYISVTLISLLLSPIWDARTLIVVGLVFIWALRLGSFLFKRILRDGKDGRFDELKTNGLRFLMVWSLQGLWVALTLAAGLAVITTNTKIPLDVLAFVGIVVWLIGFGIEVVADAQKTTWRANPQNKGKFITTGLWSKSRHPNYFGEIVLWLGMAIMAFPVLEGWQYLTLISPLFVFVLLTRMSGIPILEKRADEKWGGSEAYEKYKNNTPVLFPKFS